MTGGRWGWRSSPARLAIGAGIELPDSLALWRLAGGRPVAPARHSSDPGRELGDALESALSDGERKRGAHYTPAALADRVAAMALDGAPARPTVVDPACGGGALLVAAGARLVDAGVPRRVAARDLLWGADIDPLAAAVTEAAIALWSAGTAPAPHHVVAADLLAQGRDAWPDAPAAGFDAVVANPPFQAQLARSTARSQSSARALRARFGDVVTPYLDTAALFLLCSTALLRGGGTVAIVLPQSVAAARDAAPVRAALAREHSLRDLWVPDAPAFGAKVHVCVAAVVRGQPERGPGWSARLASARGVPDVELAGTATVGELATVAAGFRDEYYGLVGHVVEGDADAVAPLVTSGVIGVGSSAWGSAPTRFAKRRWVRPTVDLASLQAGDPRTAAWVRRLRRPKVVVASQTRVVEAAADHAGTWVPSTPVVSVIPHDPADVDRLAALLCAPPVSAWAARRQAGTALSPAAMRITGVLLGAVPLPEDRVAWDHAAERLAAGDLDGFATAATAMFAIGGDAAADLERWWADSMPKRAWQGAAGVR